EPYLTHKDFHWMGYEIKPANWNPWILSNILTVFLLTEKDNAVLNAAIEKMFCEIQHYYDALPKDGGCDEGVHYWDRAGGALFEFVYQLKLASGGALDMFYDEKLCNIGLYMKNAHIQGAQFINFADSSKAKKTSLIPLIYGYGKQTGAQILKKLARTVFCDSDKKEFEPMVNVRRNILFHDLYTEMLSDAEADGFLKEKVSLMSELQVAVLSEGEWILAAKGGHNAESHNHNDVGSFCLYLNGEAVLCDVGTGVYSRKNFSSRRYEIPWVRSLTHNLPVINGVEEKNGAEYFADIFDAEAGRVKISFAKAYPENAGIVSLVRTCNLSESGLSYTDEYEFAGNDNKVSEALVTTLSARVDGECVILGEKYVIRAQGAVPKIEFISFEEDRNLTPAWGCEGLNRITFDFENVKAVTVTVSLR
ncbi:MAG: heparinase II/III family protein, partial [Clostridia bacterium]|nr:heparinase II/III family protein [Clostridia bacterium]